MKKLLLILGILIFLDILYFCYLNRHDCLVLTYKPFIDSFSLNSALVYLFMSLYGAIGAFFICYYRISNLNEKVKKQSRKREKASIETEESLDKIKALEAKIATLEVALKEALKK